MAKKNLSDRISKQMASIENAASKSKTLQMEITEETKVDDIKGDDAKRLKTLKDTDLVDDPINADLYGDEEDRDLVEAMKIYGFQGILIAYPMGNGKYMIESGHRRRNAARKAGLTSFPVYITDPPKTEWERALRLMTHNLHGRKEKPSRNAKIIHALYNAHKQELQSRKENAGEHDSVDDNPSENINKLIAMDMGLSSSAVDRYKAFGKLIPELQELGDSGEYSWTELCWANTLTKEKQMSLYNDIVERANNAGSSYVTRPWINDQIKRKKAEMTAEKLGEISNTYSTIQEPKAKPAEPRRYGAKTVMKSTDALVTILSSPTSFKQSEVGEIRASLTKLRNQLDKVMEELDKIPQ